MKLQVAILRKKVSRYDRPSFALTDDRHQCTHVSYSFVWQFRSHLLECVGPVSSWPIVRRPRGGTRAAMHDRLPTPLASLTLITLPQWSSKFKVNNVACTLHSLCCEYFVLYTFLTPIVHLSSLLACSILMK